MSSPEEKKLKGKKYLPTVPLPFNHDEGDNQSMLRIGSGNRDKHNGSFSTVKLDE